MRATTESDGGARAAACAEAIARGFLTYHVDFKEVTRRAKSRFETSNWHGMQRDARARLDLYRRAVAGVVTALAAEPEVIGGDRVHWAEVKRVYAARVGERFDREIARTFFNSVTRRLIPIAGVDPSVEFFGDEAVEPAREATDVLRIEAAGDATAAVVGRLLEEFRFALPYEDAERDAGLVAERIDARIASIDTAASVEALEALRSAFYRNKGAFVVARVVAAGRLVPLVLALLVRNERVVLDAALVEESDVSIVFGFTRSYFHVETERPREVVTFLSSLMPQKPISELYTSIGYNRHGKTELYRSLADHIETSDDRFERAPGARGMVMEVIGLRDFGVVFKIIRDAFEPPKTVTRREVAERYELVFQHDRAGRLVDTQEFEHLTFDRRRFPEPLLEELLRTASRAVTVDEDRVAIAHLYTERRVVPLDLYLRAASDEAAAEAVVDYGNAIKDLAAANVFPGDTLLKNFGVTRHGRVVFYDYDEVRLLTDCVFRRLPESRDPMDDLAPEPWFSVSERDVFPEEFRSYLGLRPGLARVFEEVHGDLFGVAFWRAMQERVRTGELADIFAYKQSLRLQGT